MRERRVLIIGGGASGTLLGAALVRASNTVHVTIVEPHARLGAGMAYATECPLHLLNVPAARMSAFRDEPGHFVDWLEKHDPGRYDARAFVPRSVYGTYLHTVAQHAQESAGERWAHARTFAVDAHVDADGASVIGADGQALEGDTIVLASGNAAPAEWPGLSIEARDSARYFGSAWEPNALRVGDPDASVLLLGTGLTAVDAVLGLHAGGHRGVITMISRRGLLPHEHRVFDTPPATNPDASTLRDLIATARAYNWRVTLDALRPRTNTLWQSMRLDEQRRFMRHVMPYWNVHRHRMAPEAARRIAELIESGRLRMLAGRTEEIVTADNGLRVPMRLRGSNERAELIAGRVINCSGPEHDVRKLRSPLMQRLIANGQATPNPLNIGLCISPSGALIDADGHASNRLFAIGPVRYGTLIETTAIPEIRTQAAEFAEAFKVEQFA
jgi:hydroxyacylglutathione hydrolase